MALLGGITAGLASGDPQLTAKVGILGLGLVVGYGVPDVAAWAGLGRQVVLGVLTAVVAVPVAWVAIVARSVLAAVGGAIGLVVVAQVGALTGLGGWVPPVAPALWALGGVRAPDGAHLGPAPTGSVSQRMNRTSMNVY
ncbi:hypothetical protein [Brevibacterium litoralis]|uniref:hypothetical protein n=1 Tax=Brevibacterium litoralis TaxID=3138935 RepID=UPI0032F041BC